VKAPLKRPSSSAIHFPPENPRFAKNSKNYQKIIPKSPNIFVPDTTTPLSTQEDLLP
jgi:hypothetical protein